LNPQDRLVERTCDLEVSYQLESQSTALQIAQNTYPINSIQSTFIDKNTLLCANTSSVYALAINGLVFLILSGITFIVLLIFLFIYIKKECINNQSYDLQNETPILNSGLNKNLDSVEIQGYNFNQNTPNYENEKPNYMRDNSKNSNDISSSSYSYSLTIVNNNAPTNNTNHKNSNSDSDFKSAEYGYNSNINNTEVNNNLQLPSLNEIEQSNNQQNNFNYGYNPNVNVNTNVRFFLKKNAPIPTINSNVVSNNITSVNSPYSYGFENNSNSIIGGGINNNVNFYLF
jgi:hypothetical protein